MPDNSYGKTFNNLYIDTLYIDNNSSTGMGATDGYNDTTNGNYLTNASLGSHGISKTHGSRWVIQVTNGSGSTIDFSTSNLRFNICTNFKDSAGEPEDADYNYYLQSGTLSASASIYFGWGNSSVSGGVLGLAAGMIISPLTLASKSGSSFGTLDGLLIPGLESDQTTTINYLLFADQIISSNILVSTRFRIQLGASFIDKLGDNRGELDGNDQLVNFCGNCIVGPDDIDCFRYSFNVYSPNGNIIEDDTVPELDSFYVSLYMYPQSLLQEPPDSLEGIDVQLGFDTDILSFDACSINPNYFNIEGDLTGELLAAGSYDEECPDSDTTFSFSLRANSNEFYQGDSANILFLQFSSLGTNGDSTLINFKRFV